MADASDVLQPPARELPGVLYAQKGGRKPPWWETRLPEPDDCDKTSKPEPKGVPELCRFSTEENCKDFGGNVMDGLSGARWCYHGKYNECQVFNPGECSLYASKKYRERSKKHIKRSADRVSTYGNSIK